MKVLVDIMHPAQVHFFKHLIARLQQRGDEVFVTAREKDVTLALLTRLNIKHQAISVKGQGLLGLSWELLYRYGRLGRIVRRFKPDVMVARVGISVGLIGKLFGIPTVIYDDMETARLQSAVGLPFATYICTGLGYYRDLGKKQVTFKGLHVLAYLATDVFTPDPEPLRAASLDPDQPYILIRTVSWQANHDIGRTGIASDQLQRLVHQLTPHGRVIISAEEALPDSLQQYANPVPVDQMHHLLAYAKLAVIEGGTMAAEAAALGVPAVCPNCYDFGYLRALDHDYHLITRPATFEQALEQALSFLTDLQQQQMIKTRHQRLLDDAQDIAGFMVDMVDRAAREHPIR